MNDYGPQANDQLSHSWSALGEMLVVLCVVCACVAAVAWVAVWMHDSYLVVREAKRVVLSEPPSGVRLLGTRPPYDIEKDIA